MGAKTDLVVWLRLQPEQQRIYEVPDLQTRVLLCCALKGRARPGAGHLCTDSVPGRVLQHSAPSNSTRGALLELIPWSLQAFLGTEVVKAALNLTGSALAAITGEHFEKRKNGLSGYVV